MDNSRAVRKAAASALGNIGRKARFDTPALTLPYHSRDMAEGTLRAILREAGINVEDFLGV